MGDMPAYVIAETETIDEAQGQRYRELAAASIAEHGLRRGPGHPADGDPPAPALRRRHRPVTVAD